MKARRRSCRECVDKVMNRLFPKSASSGEKKRKRPDRVEQLCQ